MVLVPQVEQFTKGPYPEEITVYKGYDSLNSDMYLKVQPGTVSSVYSYHSV